MAGLLTGIDAAAALLQRNWPAKSGKAHGPGFEGGMQVQLVLAARSCGKLLAWALKQGPRRPLLLLTLLLLLQRRRRPPQLLLLLLRQRPLLQLLLLLHVASLPPLTPQQLPALLHTFLHALSSLDTLHSLCVIIDL